MALRQYLLAEHLNNRPVPHLEAVWQASGTDNDAWYGEAPAAVQAPGDRESRFYGAVMAVMLVVLAWAASGGDGDSAASAPARAAGAVASATAAQT